MALSTADALRLASLRLAYDQLIAGNKIAKVSSGDRSVDYSAADINRLEAEIRGLEAMNETGRRRGAISFGL